MAKFKRSSVASTLSLTPLIDVVFLLLIFFLVTSEFEEEERRLDIVLPSATSAVPMTAIKTIAAIAVAMEAAR